MPIKLNPADGISLPDISFSRFLGVKEQAQLQKIGQWRFISTLGPEPLQSARNQRYQLWINHPENLHAPAHREALLVLRGNGFFCLDGTAQRLHPGTVILFDHHESRTNKNFPDFADYDHLWLHLLSRNSLTFNTNSRDAEGRTFRALPRRVGSDLSARQLMDTWDHCKAHPTDGMARAFLYSLLTTTFLEILGRATPEPPSDHHRQIISSIREHIRAHLTEDLSLESLSDIAGYSTFFFHRLFLKHTGQTPGEFVKSARLEKAKQLLLQNYTVEATAEKVGFDSLSYFSRLFRKTVGQTPAAWRASHQML